MKKLLCLLSLLCLCATLVRCGYDYDDLAVDEHDWTFYTMTITNDAGTSTACHPALSDRFPDAEPMQCMLLPTQNDMAFELVIGEDGKQRGLLTFAPETIPGEKNRKLSRYSVMATSYGVEDSSLCSAVVSTEKLEEETVFTLVISMGDYTYTFTAPLDD